MSIDDYIKNVPQLPGKPTSVWLDTTDSLNLPVFEGEAEADVVIVGGGLVGILTAFILVSAKKKVILLEAGEIGGDVTGHTTAKITSQHGLIYNRLKNKFGQETARLYGQANETGIKLIETLVKEHHLRCDFQKTDAYLFTEDLSMRGKLIEETNVAEKLGLPADFTGKLDLPFPIQGAEHFKEQAKFHPRKFILELVPKILERGGLIYEHSRAIKLEDGDVCEVATEHGRIISKKLVVATNYPVYDTGHYYTKLYPYRSYAIAAEVENPVPEGLYYEVGKHEMFSFRSQRVGIDNLLIFGGQSHYAGRASSHMKMYADLEKAIKAHGFIIKDIRYHWSTQDNATPDGLPYIGLSPRTKNTYLATGFDGWGMSHSAVSAIILGNLILGKEDATAKIYNPSRFGPKAWPTFVSKNVSSALHLLKDNFKREKFTLVSDIPEGEGRIIETKKKNVAVYKNKEGELSAHSAKCTHMGCGLHWNEAEKTWDCHCHGSRFNAQGQVIHGPAKKDLDDEDVKFE